MSAKKLKVNDRVKRANAPGCLGTVKDIRQEITQTGASQENKEKALMINVLWDNGTLSCFAPESLEVVKE